MLYMFIICIICITNIMCIMKIKFIIVPREILISGIEFLFV